MGALREGEAGRAPVPVAAARALRGALLVSVLLFGAPRAQATAIGTFHEGTDGYAEITFSFNPLAGAALELLVSVGGTVTKSLSGCDFQLFDGGGLISSATLVSAIGCNGRWRADGTAFGDLIDGGVDLSGLAAGETGTIRMTPLFVAGPPGEFNMDMPFVFLDGNAASISSQEIVAVPEPSPAVLLLGGLAAGAWRGRARARR
jgi:hypothetical protein